MIKKYTKFLIMIMTVCCVNAAVGQISDCESITPFERGSGPWYSEGTSYNFEAQSSNDAILAMGSGDLTIEVLQAHVEELP